MAKIDREKDVEELAQLLHGSACGGNCHNKSCCCEDYFKAEKVINLGYGNVSQAVNEFLNKMKDKFAKRISELKNREEECLEVGDTETATRCKVAYNEIQNVLNGFDNIIKELYGNN